MKAARSDEAVSTAPLVGHWIDGKASDQHRRTLPVHNPASGMIVRDVAIGGVDVVETAVKAATEAASRWGQTPVSTRMRSLRRWREGIADRHDDLVRIMGEEQGKVRADAEGELMRGLETIDFACAAADRLKGEISDNIASEIDAFSVRAPLGVSAAITPFNFPFMAPAYLSSIAMACGNAVVLKPSERVPSASLLLARLALEVGIPAGVLNVVQGDAEVVNAILDHPGIASVSFIGSTPVARHVYSRGAASGKRVQAFGGAKNHMVVMPDADIEFAADSACSAAYGSTGQRCMAISVVVAVGGCGDALVKAIAKRADALRLGSFVDPSAEMGPLVSAGAKAQVVEAIDAAQAEGATLTLDGRLHEMTESSGYFVGPTLIDRVSPDMEVYKQEVFGPVLCVVRAATLDHAIQMIDDNPYGNGAAIFTASGRDARVFQSRASAGMIGINVPIPIPHAAYSFGGWKDSRFGDQHMAGTEGFRFFTKQKVVTSRWPDSPTGGVNLAFPTTDQKQEEQK